MNEEMKQKIEEEAEELYSFKGRYPEFNCRQALIKEAFIDGAEYGYNLANQWISVEDKLLEADIEVLCSFIGWDDNIF